VFSYGLPSTVQKSYGLTEESPEKGHKCDEVTESSLAGGKAVMWACVVRF